MIRVGLLLAIVPIGLQAATCTASTFALFQSCIQNAAAGDTTNVTANLTWTANTTATVGLTIQGVGNPIMTTGGFSLLLQPTGTATTLMRVTGLIFNITGVTAIQVNGAFAVAANNGNLMRIDSNVFNQLDILGHSIIIGFGDWRSSSCATNYGLIDHNTFFNTRSGGQDATLMLLESCNQTWNSDANLGNAQALYIESNNFFCQPNWDAEADVMDSDYGGRYVLRYNNLMDCSVLGHDVGSQAESSGQRTFEIYNNNFYATGFQLVNSFSAFRGGTGVWHHNNIQISTGSNSGSNIFNDTEIQRLLCLGSAPFGTDNCGASGLGCTQTSRKICSTLRSFCGPTATANQRSTCDSTNNGDSFCGGVAGSCQATCTADSQCPVGSVCLANGITGGGLDGPASNGLYCRNQSGASKTVLSPNTNQVADPAYLWLNCNTVDVLTAPCAGGAPVTGMKEVFQNTNIAGLINPDREYFGWNTSPGATQSSGTSVGLLSARPGCGLVGVGYWATDTNTLYTCTVTGTPGTWVVKYTPFTFPHPLIPAGGGSTVAAKVTIGGGVTIQ